MHMHWGRAETVRAAQPGAISMRLAACSGAAAQAYPSPPRCWVCLDRISTSPLILHTGRIPVARGCELVVYFIVDLLPMVFTISDSSCVQVYLPLVKRPVDFGVAQDSGRTKTIEKKLRMAVLISTTRGVSCRREFFSRFSHLIFFH